MNDNTTYYQRNRAKLLKRVYENKKEKLQEQARNKHSKLSNEDKNIKRQ